MNRKAPRELRELDRIVQSLAETTSLKNVKSIRDQAEAFRHYAHAASLGLKAQNRAAEVKLRAERRAGELLAKMVNHGGSRNPHSKKEPVKLKELGIDHNQSARWQREAAVPDAVFEKYVSEANAAGKEITAQGLLRLERSIIGAPSRRHNGAPLTLDEDKSVAQFESGDSNSLIDKIAELLNHRKLLEQILSLIWSDHTSQIKPPERKLALRLLHEMEELLQTVHDQYEVESAK